MISLIFAVSILFLIAQYVPPDEFGYYSLIMSIVLVCSSGVLSLGNHALLRFGNDEYAQSGCIGSLISLRLILFVIMYLFVVCGLWILSPHVAHFLSVSPKLCIILLLGLLVVPMSESGIYAAQATNCFAGYGPAQALARGVQLILVIIMIILDRISWEWILLSVLIGHIASATFMWCSLPVGTMRGFRLNTVGLWKFSKFGFFIPIASISVAVIGSVDLWFISTFWTIEEAGSYAWAYAVCFIGTAFFAPVGALLTNKYLDLRRSAGQEKIEEMLIKSYSLVMLLIGTGVLLASTVVIISSYLTEFLGQYSAAILPAVILIAGIGFQLGTNIWESIAFGRQGRTLKASLILVFMAFTNICLDWILVPKIGSAGASLATITSFSVGALGLYALIKNTDALKHKFSLLRLTIIVSGALFTASYIMISDDAWLGEIVLFIGLFLTLIGWLMIGDTGRQGLKNSLRLNTESLGPR